MEEDLRLLAAEIFPEIKEKTQLCWIAAIFLATDEVTTVRRKLKKYLTSLEIAPENLLSAIAKMICFDSYDFLSELYRTKTVKEVMKVNPQFEIDFVLYLREKFQE